MAGSRRHLARRGRATLVVLVSVGAGLVPAQAATAGPTAASEPGGGGPPRVDWWDDLERLTPSDDPAAPPVTPAESAPAIEDEPLAGDDEDDTDEDDDPDAAADLPDAGVAELTLGGEGQAKQAGDLPVEIVPGSGAGRGEAVQVEVLDHDVTARAGLEGFAFRISGRDGHRLAPARGDDLPATVEVDYSSFENLYGAGYGDRLRMVALPGCALADPVPRGWDRRGRPLPAVNDHDRRTVAVDVADLAARESTVLALVAGPEGEGGSFKASPLSVSGDWQVGIGSGELTWNYDLPLPDAPAGPTPQISLTYSSGAIDGMASSRNTRGGGTSIASSTPTATSRPGSTCRRPTSTTRSRPTTTGSTCWAVSSRPSGTASGPDHRPTGRSRSSCRRHGAARPSRPTTTRSPVAARARGRTSPTLRWTCTAPAAAPNPSRRSSPSAATPRSRPSCRSAPTASWSTPSGSPTSSPTPTRPRPPTPSCGCRGSSTPATIPTTAPA